MFSFGATSFDRQPTASVTDRSTRPEVQLLPSALDRRDRPRRSVATDRSETSKAAAPSVYFGNLRWCAHGFRFLVMATLLFCLVTANCPSASAYSNRRRGPPLLGVDSGLVQTLLPRGKNISYGIGYGSTPNDAEDEVRPPSLAGSLVTGRKNDVDMEVSDPVWNSQSRNAVERPVRHYRHRQRHRLPSTSRASFTEDWNDYDLEVMADQPREVDGPRRDDEHLVSCLQLQSRVRVSICH
jgi:hypothetical protein